MIDADVRPETKAVTLKAGENADERITITTVKSVKDIHTVSYQSDYTRRGEKDHGRTEQTNRKEKKSRR